MMRAERATVVSAVLAVFGGAVAAFAPLGTTTSAAGAPGVETVRTEHVSLFAHDGSWVLVVVTVPILIALAPVLVRRRGVAVASAVLLWACCVLGALSVGIFFVPSAIAMTVAAATAPRASVGTMPAS
jgi:hypothetical protein